MNTFALAAMHRLTCPTNPNAETYTKDMQAAADTLGQKLLVVRASTEPDIDAAFTALVRQQAGALVVVSDTFFNSRPAKLVALAARHAMPAIYGNRDYTEAGGLMSYGPNIGDAWYRLSP